MRYSFFFIISTGVVQCFAYTEKENNFFGGWRKRCIFMTNKRIMRLFNETISKKYSLFGVVSLCVLFLSLGIVARCVNGECEDSNLVVQEESSNASTGNVSAVSKEGKTPISSSNIKTSQNGLRQKTMFKTLLSNISALILILGIFLGGVYFLRLSAPNRFKRSSNFVEVVDSCFLGRKTELVTFKWGPKLILASLSLDKLTPVSEIEDSNVIGEMLAKLEKKQGRKETLSKRIGFGVKYEAQTEESETK